MSDRAERTRVREPVAGVGSTRPVRRPGLATWGWSVAAGAVTAALLTVRSRPDVDLWLHLRIGGLLRDGGRFEGLPDPLAVLPDRSYVPTQWLAQVSMSGLYDAGGMAAIQLLRVILVVALVGLVALACRTVAGPTATAATTTVTAFGTSAAWGERPAAAGHAAPGRHRPAVVASRGPGTRSLGRGAADLAVGVPARDLAHRRGRRGAVRRRRRARPTLDAAAPCCRPLRCRQPRSLPPASPHSA